ncbi:MAG: hypothetical protein H0W86_12080 [Armatimonadetes bacterium]|nr:hypothetical protein [Armatimonadota bacterium]
MDPPDKARRDPEQYQLLQAAAQVELCRRAIGREPDVSDWKRWIQSNPDPIDPFAVLSKEQIEQVLSEAKGIE